MTEKTISGAVFLVVSVVYHLQAIVHTFYLNKLQESSLLMTNLLLKRECFFLKKCTHTHDLFKYIYVVNK